jgi:hypothetical protein
VVKTLLCACVIAAGVAAISASGRWQEAAAPPLEWFFTAASADDRAARQAMDRLAAQWRDGYAAMIVDMARQLRMTAPTGGVRGGADINSPTNPADSIDDDVVFPTDQFGDVAAAATTGESRIRARLMGFLEKQTRKRFDPYLRGWRDWMWTLPYEPHPEYARFKGVVYARIDPRMERFFPSSVRASVRLDEIDWGGVTVNGIPPLYYPKVMKAAEARYLRDNHLVFGVVVNGEARAYPKRILAWHEMAIDRLGGTELTVVYCTLCGTVIPYDSVAAGRRLRFGTSGLLYRSNKLVSCPPTPFQTSRSSRKAELNLKFSISDLRFRSAP